MTILGHLARYTEYLTYERYYAPSTVRCYLHDLRKLALDAPGDVAEITPANLRFHIRRLSAEGLNPSTVQRAVAGFSTFWRWLRLEGLVTDIVTDLVHAPRGKDRVARWLSKDDLRLIVNTQPHRVRTWMEERDHCMWLLLAWLGLRRSEVINLRIEDILMGEDVIIIRAIKGKCDRVLPLPPQVKSALAGYLGVRTSGYAFTSSTGHKLCPRMFAEAFAYHLEVCGLGGRGITPHMLRHTVATQLVASGANLIDVKDILGHADIKTTMVYVHTDHTRLRRAINLHVLNEGYLS